MPTYKLNEYNYRIFNPNKKILQIVTYTVCTWFPHVGDELFLMGVDRSQLLKYNSHGTFRGG